MLKRFRDYVENEPWERHFDEDSRAMTIFCWALIIVCVCWFVPPVVRVILWGPAR